MSDGRAAPWFRHFRWVLLVLGLGAMVALVHRQGPKTIFDALAAAGPFVPVLMALEAGWMGMDILVLRAVLGDRAGDVRWSVYVRSAITIYPVNILFPAGRVSAEATRAALLSPHLGGKTTALAAVLTQGASLLGNALLSVVAVVVVGSTLGVRHPLVPAVALSAVLTGATGLLLLFGWRNSRTQALLKRFVHKDGPPLVADPTWRPLRAIAWSFVGRSIQGGLFTGALLATSGRLSLRRGLIAQSIAIAGSTIGDVVPQQAGVMEGAFEYFCAAMGLDGRPDKALATALLIRACQIGLTAVTLLLTLVFRWTASSEASRAVEG